MPIFQISTDEWSVILLQGRHFFGQNPEQPMKGEGRVLTNTVASVHVTDVMRIGEFSGFQCLAVLSYPYPTLPIFMKTESATMFMIYCCTS